MSTLAARKAANQRHYRARRRDGGVVVPVAIDDVLVPQALAAFGFLDQRDVDNREAIGHAIERLLQIAMGDSR